MDRLFSVFFFSFIVHKVVKMLSKQIIGFVQKELVLKITQNNLTTHYNS